MTYDVKNLPAMISLGKAGENAITEIVLDVSAWAKDYPKANFAVVVERADGACYPVEITHSDGLITWLVTANETVKGYGKLEVRMLDGDVLAKSATTATYVSPSLDTGDTPEPTVPDWVNDLLRKIQDLIEKGVTPEQIEAAVTEYLDKHPIDAVTREQCLQIVTDYVAEQGFPSLADVDAEVEAYVTAHKDDITNTSVKYDDLDGESIYYGADGKVHSAGGGSTVDVLANKKILFIGDSICQGVNANNSGDATLPNYTGVQSPNAVPYSYWIAKAHPHATVINEGIGGQTIAYNGSATNSIAYRVMNGDFEKYKNDTDIVVVQGGINDTGALGFARGGYSSVRSDVNPSGLVRPKGTMFTALEYILEYFVTNFVGAKVYFMSTYNVPNYEQDKQRAWYAGASEICNHLGCGYIDVYGNVPTALFPVGSMYYTQLHANRAVHKDYVSKVVDNALTSGSVSGSQSRIYFGREVPYHIYLYSGKTSFNVGETFSCSDWRINGNTCEGRYITVTANLSTATNCYYDSSAVDTSKEGIYPVYVTFADKGVTCQTIVNVTVKGATEKTLESISATKTKTSYSKNDTLNIDDITTTATYSDGSTATVNGVIDKEDVDMTNEGTYYIHVSYTENGVTKTTDITIIVTATPTPPEPSEWDAEVTANGSWSVLNFEPAITNPIPLYASVEYQTTLTVLSEKAGTGVKLGWGSGNMGALQTAITLKANEEQEIVFVNTKVGTNTPIGEWKLLCVAPNISSGKIKVKNVTLERV